MTASRAKHNRRGADRGHTGDQHADGADLHGVTRKLRCAVYTRKSSEEGLEMAFNSLDAQREACEAYIASQRGEGWVLVPDRYDDGGVSGGTLDRPALKRLLADVEAGRIDIVVVYKVDRLSRSLLGFHKLIELFERHKTTFVSITQSFNTTDAMGRMHLNIMLTFAQYEREVIGERIRDKVAASRKKGMWMGGWTPLGYEVRDRKLIIQPADADRVRSIFKRFVQLKSATLLARELVLAGATNRYGHLLDKGVLYRLLNNRVYIGEAVHKGVSYPGEHQAIIDRKLWDQAHAILKLSPRKRAANTRAQTPALLKGLLFGPDGSSMSPTHTRKGGGFIGTKAEEITERKRAEAALQASERQFHTLADSIPQLVWLADAGGTIFWFNNHWYEYTGTPVGETTSHDWQAFLASTSLHEARDRCGQALEAGMALET